MEAEIKGEKPNGAGHGTATEMAMRLEAVGRLAGGMAHNFNNLLTAINGNSELILAMETDGEVKECAEEIRKAGIRAAALTRQLLAFSRRQMLMPQSVDLNAIIENMAENIRNSLGPEIQVLISLDPDLGPVFADPEQVESIIMTLVLNARDAMPTGGQLGIQTGCPGSNDATVEGCMVLVVWDSGAGMDAKTKARLFEPFFTTKPMGTGMGLGLSTVFGTVKQSGGEIFVESHPGAGTRFRVCLPVWEPEEP